MGTNVMCSGFVAFYMDIAKLKLGGHSFGNTILNAWWINFLKVCTHKIAFLY